MITKTDLAHFTGTENHYQHRLMRSVRYTDGVQFLAKNAQAYWLIDKIATLQLEKKIRAADFQAWQLVVTNNTATLTCKDDDVILHSEHITFTDFPLDEITLWVEGGVILLPSEH
ncbi:DUF6876 family protein [Bradyrhizobium diazoefficiens]|nr:hypothetical protein XF16B_45650 [Bradyrhizobium diazoefficiens]BCF70218.1 hypothetical protein XF19B_45710 [Bradyrhizobium diazoefficiens]